MKIYAINGSPRKNHNTTTVLENALEGTREAFDKTGERAETEMIHLYDYRFQGCRSCFACKRLDGKSYGRCAVKDELSERLSALRSADILILGSPLYFANVTGVMKSFMERFLFPYYAYDAERSSLAPKRIPVGMIYTMNVPKWMMYRLKYDVALKQTENFIRQIFTEPEVLYVTDTYQFDDYTRYKAEAFDEAEKARAREDLFPRDCEKAKQMGRRLAEMLMTKER